MQKKIDKYNLLSCFLLIAFFTIYVFLLTKNEFYYGSSLDWESQHITIPQYFRILFYDTHNLIPNFASNIGNGQNIYNFAYYGFLSPIILISFLLPFINMPTFISISTIICVIIGSILFYYFLRKHNRSHLVSFLGSFILLFATSISFHSHRHIMFVNYLPFLVLGLYGVDKKLTQNKGWLLSISVFLMIMTSYYYSVSGIFCLVFYGIYYYLKLHKNITFKSFIIDGLKFIYPIIIGILLASIIILPTFYVILSGRGETFNTITLKDLLLPGINISYVLYEPYGIGLTSILIYAIINLYFKKKEDIYLAIILSLMIIFPFINYLLNATMYIDAKCLIPMLPLMVIAIVKFIEDLFKSNYKLKILLPIVILISLLSIPNNNDIKYYLIDIIILTIFILIYTKFKFKTILIIPIMLIPFIASYERSKGDTLVNKEYEDRVYKNIGNTISYITSTDDSLYRISNNLTILRDVNNLFSNIDYYSGTLYSSTYSKNYNNYYYDIINNPIQNRNRVITSGTSNIMSLYLTNSKYLISNGPVLYGYKYVDSVNGNNIYKNDQVLPYAYASSNLLSKEDYDKLPYPATSEVLLNTIVVEDNVSNNFTSHIEPYPFDLSKLILNDLNYEITDDYYLVKVPESKTITYPIDESLKNKLIFIRFQVLESMACSFGDTAITINSEKNKLTCAEWKYHNQNYTFDYIIGEQDLNNLTISFDPGEYKIKNIEVYTLDYQYLSNLQYDEFLPDKNATKGDDIVGTINVTEDGYFATTIPYDKGFQVLVDNQEVPIEKVNTSFLGFKISKGSHNIKITYTAPLRNISLATSSLGLILFLTSTYLESSKKKLKKA